MFPRHVKVLLPVDQMDRTVQRDGPLQQQMVAPVVNQLLCNCIRRVAIFGRRKIEAVALNRLADFRRLVLPHQGLGEIRRGGKADQPGNALRAGKGGKQHDPAAHRRSDEDLRPVGQRVDRGDGVV